MRYTCDDLRDRWPAFVYRELTEPEQSLFVQHLEECSRCRCEEEKWRDLLERFDTIAALDDSMEAPYELLYRVKRQVRLYEKLSHQFSLRVKRWMVGAVAACFLVILAFYGSFVRTDFPPFESEFVSPPLQKTVLRSIYQTDTLKVYREQGILDECQISEATCLASIRVHHENPNGEEKE